MFATVYDRYYNTHDGYCGADGDGADAYDWLHLRTKDFSQICRLSGRNRLLDICEHHQPCRDAWDASESSVSIYIHKHVFTRLCICLCVCPSVELAVIPTCPTLSLTVHLYVFIYRNVRWSDMDASTMAKGYYHLPANAKWVDTLKCIVSHLNICLFLLSSIQ